MSADVTVVKCGNAITASPDSFCRDLARRRALGERYVVVHGGRHAISELAATLGVPERLLVAPDGLASRYTDPAMLDVATMAMLGRVKPRLLAAFRRAGVAGVGLTGLDGGLLTARRKAVRRSVTGGRTTLVRDDHSGRITGVNPVVTRVLLDAGMVPVVSPPAAGPDGEPLNVDADRAAAALAVALGAARLLLLTGASGLLRDPGNESTLVAHAALPPGTGRPAVGLRPGGGSQLELRGDGIFRKLIAASEALRGGVPVVRICDGRIREPVTAAADGGTILTLGPDEPSGDPRESA